MTKLSVRLWTSVVSLLACAAIPASGQNCAGAAGTICAWGLNLYGQLGTNTNAGTYNANPVPLQNVGVSGVKAIAGSSHSLALTGDGRVWAWGANRYGQLGSTTNNGDIVANPTPTQIAGLSGVIAVSAGGSHSLALTEDGRVWAWGSNQFGQLGNGTSTLNAGPVPSQIAGLSGVVAISAGTSHSLAVTSDGRVWGWGSNAWGEAGSIPANAGDQTIPAPIAGLSGIIAVAAGNFSSLGLTSDGHVWAWGVNQAGQTGQIGFATYTPVAVSSLAGIVAVAAGNAYSFALAGDGRVWAWGSNEKGQLGNPTNFGTTTSNRNPVQIAGLTGIKALTAGWGTGGALAGDGQVWVWGSNTHVPARVGSLAGVTAIAAGGEHVMALINPATPTVPQAPARLVISAPTSAMAGFLHAFGFGVTAVDANGQTVSTYSGTLRFTSTDPRAVLPGNSPLTNGVGGFPCQFMTPGTHTITATDIANPALMVTSSPITVTARVPAGFVVTAPSTAIPGSAFTVNINPVDSNNQYIPDYVGFVRLSSTDPSAVLPAEQYIAGWWSITATLFTSGSHTITVRDTTTPSATGTSNAIVVSPAQPVRFLVSAPSSVKCGTAFGVTITAVNANNQTVTGYGGKVHFSSSDMTAILPGDVFLTNGTGTFAVTLGYGARGRSHTIAVVDTANSGLTGTSGPIAATLY